MDQVQNKFRINFSITNSSNAHVKQLHDEVVLTMNSFNAVSTFGMQDDFRHEG